MVKCLGCRLTPASMIFENLKSVQSRIRAAAEKSGRDPGQVRLLPVTKYASPEALQELLSSGLVSEIGESRVQAVEAKKAALGALAGKVRWRMIGRLQSNKARRACELFDAVDSVDNDRLAMILDSTMLGMGRVLPVLVQVKLAPSDTQGGLDPEELEGFLERNRARKGLRIEGLMGIAPNLEPVEAVRPYFRNLNGLFERFFARRQGALLSMGMSRDFEIAVEEGADLVRVGSQIFAPSARSADSR